MSWRRCNFERAEAQLIKPDSLCIDLRGFTVDKACEEYKDHRGRTLQPLRIEAGRFAERSVDELAKQGSYHANYARGLLGALVGSGRRAPLSPEAFATVLRTKRFTNGADADTVIKLYRETATALLGSAK